MFVNYNKSLIKPVFQAAMAVIWIVCAQSIASANCAVSASPMNFPPYDVFHGVPVQTQSEIGVNCDPDILYAVKITSGLNASGDYSQRQMLSVETSTPLFYNLFLDASYTRIWGDGTGFSEAYSGAGDGRLQIMRIFGRIPSAQNVPAGQYSDSVVITVEW